MKRKTNHMPRKSTKSIYGQFLRKESSKNGLYVSRIIRKGDEEVTLTNPTQIGSISLKCIGGGIHRFGFRGIYKEFSINDNDSYLLLDASKVRGIKAASIGGGLHRNSYINPNIKIRILNNEGISEDELDKISDHVAKHILNKGNTSNTERGF